MKISKEVREAWEDLERCYAVHDNEKELCAGEFAAYQRALLDAGIKAAIASRKYAKGVIDEQR